MNLGKFLGGLIVFFGILTGIVFLGLDKSSIAVIIASFMALLFAISWKE